MRIYSEKWTRKEIHRTITELKNDKLIAHIGNDYFKVTEWGHDCVCHIMHTDNYHEALRKLKTFGVFHPDMVRDKIMSQEEANELK